MAEKQYFPMISEISWWTLRQQFKKAIPTVVTVSYLKSLLGLTSDQSARNILSPLKQLKIIDEEGKPLSRANDWRNDAKYPQVCKEMLLDVYPSELLDLFPDDEIDVALVKNWFMDVCAIGASGAFKTASTFCLLKKGKINDLSEKKGALKTPKVSLAKGEITNNRQVTVDQENLHKESVHYPEMTNISPNNVVPTVHIDLQIHISPAASVAQIDSIFASIAKHLYSRG